MPWRHLPGTPWVKATKTVSQAITQENSNLRSFKILPLLSCKLLASTTRVNHPWLPQGNVATYTELLVSPFTNRTLPFADHSQSTSPMPGVTSNGWVREVTGSYSSNNPAS